MKHIVGVADAKISSQVGDVIVTHALGSCLGVVVHDPVAHVGGLLHVMMPQSEVNPEKAAGNPYMFVDTGLPAFFRQVYAQGGIKSRLKVKIAGGANVHDTGNDHFAVGKRNYLTLRKLFWKNGILIESEDVGGKVARTVYLEIGTGRVWMHVAGQEKEL